VLFVHGALGNPNNFRALINSLDRNRFQAWVAYYPTAVRLDIVGGALGRWLQALEVEYGFQRLGLVAHSMGGLVARSYLAGDPYGLGGTIDALTFVSIATPWQGHAAAALGVARAPVPAPSWFDMAPGSPFLNRLLASPLPPCAVHDLYFAYGGSRRSRTANDGVVTVASQLDLRAQDQARRVVGFDAQHAAVLDSPTVADELRRSLASLRAEDAPLKLLTGLRVAASAELAIGAIDAALAHSVEAVDVASRTKRVAEMAEAHADAARIAAAAGRLDDARRELDRARSLDVSTSPRARDAVAAAEDALRS